MPRPYLVGSMSGQRWLYSGLPGAADYLVFGFHYAGTGAASTYGGWPREIGAGLLCQIQPPGRENRIAEPSVSSHREFAELLAPVLLPLLNRPYALIGHCGAVPYFMETAFRLDELGAQPPQLLLASAWGPPQHGPYGRLNIEPMADLDPMAEVQTAARTRFGCVLQPDIAEIAAESLMADLMVQRTHSYDGEPRLPARTVAIGWEQDQVVPSELATDPRWTACGEVEFRTLPGDHWEFMRGPDCLVDLIATEMTRDRPGSEPPHG